jgi:hypothetical protein
LITHPIKTFLCVKGFIVFLVLAIRSAVHHCHANKEDMSQGFLVVKLSFIDRGLLLTRRILNQRFLVVKTKPSFRKIYGPDLVNRYGVSVSQMTTYNCRLLWSQSIPFLIHDVSARCVTSVKRRVPLLEHTLFTFPEHLWLTPVLVGLVLLNLQFSV